MNNHRLLYCSALLFATLNCSASTFRINLQSNVLPLISGQTPLLPLPFTSGAATLAVSFSVDETSQQLFGDFACAPLPHTQCGAYGYQVYNLRVFVSGIEQTGWRAGTNSNSFYNGPIDMRGSNFFTPGGLSGIENAWLPLVHDDFAGAAMNFGQMYTSLGGFNFTSFYFAAIDILNQRANGDISTTSALTLSVPEASSFSLVCLGLFAVSARKISKQRSQSQHSKSAN